MQHGVQRRYGVGTERFRRPGLGVRCRGCRCRLRVNSVRSVLCRWYTEWSRHGGVEQRFWPKYNFINNVRSVQRRQTVYGSVQREYTDGVRRRYGQTVYGVYSVRCRTAVYSVRSVQCTVSVYGLASLSVRSRCTVWPVLGYACLSLTAIQVLGYACLSLTAIQVLGLGYACLSLTAIIGLGYACLSLTAI